MSGLNSDNGGGESSYFRETEVGVETELVTIGDVVSEMDVNDYIVLVTGVILMVVAILAVTVFLSATKKVQNLENVLQQGAVVGETQLKKARRNVHDEEDADSVTSTVLDSNGPNANEGKKSRTKSIRVLKKKLEKNAIGKRVLNTPLHVQPTIREEDVGLMELGNGQNRERGGSEGESFGSRSFGEDDSSSFPKGDPRREIRAGIERQQNLTNKASQSYGAIQQTQSKDSSEGSAEGSKGSGSQTSSVFEKTVKQGLQQQMLKGGVTCKLHRMYPQTTKNIKLSLLNDTKLRWKDAKKFLSTNHDVDLMDVMSIDWGKNTDVFQSWGKDASVAATDNDVCFSFVTATSTLDIEVESKVMRDLLVQGFCLLIKESRPEDSNV